MYATLEVKEGLKRHLTVKLPAETFKNKRKEHLHKKAQKAKIQGFRPGKAPLDVVNKYFGAEIAEHTMDDLISTSLKAAFDQEKVYPVSRPNIESLKANEGEDFEYVASFEIAPAIDKVHFDNITIEKIESQVTTADIDKVLENMAKQFGQYVEKQAPAENNDRVTIDFEGSVNGEKFEGGTAKNYAYVLGAGQMIPGFDEGILGMKAGDAKTIHVTFPEQYHADLAGKAAEFKIHLNKVEHLKAADINEALIQRLGVASGDLAQLKQEIEKTLTRELKRKLRQDLTHVVFDKLLEQNPIEVPAGQVHDEIHHLMGEAKERFKKMTGKKETPDFPHDMFEGEAKRRVRNSYLLMKIIEENQLKADAATVRALAEEMAASYENPDQVREYYLSNPEQYRHLENLALEDAVVNHLLSKATVKSIEKPYAELMGK